MNVRTKIKLGVFAFLTLVATGLFLSAVRWINVEGTERVVWQTFSGVSEEVAADGIHFYFGLTTTPHKYFVGTDTFIVDDKTVNPRNSLMTEEELAFNQPDSAPIEIPVMMDKLTDEDRAAGKTTGPTNIQVSCNMQYSLNPGTLVSLHRQSIGNYRTTLINPVMIKALNDLITPLDARSVYQGADRIALQNRLQERLSSDDQFNEYGIVVERFVLTEVIFKDQEFLKKIQREALAEQARKTAIKEQAAALAEAKAEEARARSEQNRRLVEAETQKGEQIAKAEAEARQRVLAAEAQKEEARLRGEGIKLQKIAEAEGVLALGQAEAEAKRLQLEAYQGEGGHRFAEVEKAKALGAGISKIYYVPESMSINSIANDFQNAVTVGLPSSND